jgi:hypothetical protein
MILKCRTDATPLPTVVTVAPDSSPRW